MKKVKYKLGKAQELWKCCREVRYAGLSPKVGDVLTGLNTNTNMMEKWLVLKVAKEWSNHIVQEIISEK